MQAGQKEGSVRGRHSVDTVALPQCEQPAPLRASSITFAAPNRFSGLVEACVTSSVLIVTYIMSPMQMR